MQGTATARTNGSFAAPALGQAAIGPLRPQSPWELECAAAATRSQSGRTWARDTTTTHHDAPRRAATRRPRRARHSPVATQRVGTSLRSHAGAVALQRAASDKNRLDRAVRGCRCRRSRPGRPGGVSVLPLGKVSRGARLLLCCSHVAASHRRPRLWPAQATSCAGRTAPARLDQHAPWWLAAGLACKHADRSHSRPVFCISHC